MNRETFQNILFIAIWILLLLLIPLNYWVPSLYFVFKPFFGWTPYFWLILIVTFETFLWGALRLKARLSFSNIIKAFLVFVGFKKRQSRAELMLGILVGGFSVIVTVLSRAYFESLTLQVTNPIVVLFLLFTRFEAWCSILIIPAFEETIYRGLFINRLMRIFSGKKLFVGTMAIISSSFIFGWSHPEMPMYKAFAGFILGIVYMWRWRNNILTTIVAHSSANLLFFFLTVQ